MTNALFKIDQGITQFFAENRDPFLYDFFSWLTTFGDWWVVLLILFVMLLVLETRHKVWRLAALAFSFAGSQALVFLLKYAFGRERPGEISGALIQGFSDTASFPSGHATTAVAFYGLLVYFVVWREKETKKKKLFAISGAVFVFAIGFSRIYIGVHYVTDMIAGFAIGGIFLALSILISQKRVPAFVKTRLEQFEQPKKPMQKTQKSDRIQENS